MRDVVREVLEVREQVRDMTDEGLRSMLDHEQREFAWNAAADEINRRHKARREDVARRRAAASCHVANDRLAQVETTIA